MDIDMAMPTDYELAQRCQTVLERVIGDLSPTDAETSSKSAVTARIRINGIQKEAKVSGAKWGAIDRYQAITDLVETRAVQRELDTVFNFGSVMRMDSIIPPVITEVTGSVELATDRQSAATTKRSWRIIKPARITTGKLSWRSYVDLSFASKAEPPVVSAFYAPTNKAERKAWQVGVCDGYRVGLQQANNVFMQQVSDLKRDYLGMWSFRQLEEQGVVSSPKVIEERLGTLVDDNVVFIDKRDVRISEPTKFKKEEAWTTDQMK